MYIVCIIDSRHQCILKEISQKLDWKTYSFQERLYFKTYYEICVDSKKPNSVQIEKWVPSEKQHFTQFSTTFFTENLDTM